MPRSNIELEDLLEEAEEEVAALCIRKSDYEAQIEVLLAKLKVKNDAIEVLIEKAWEPTR